MSDTRTAGNCWYIHQMPAGFHWLSVGFMFYAELAAPFCVFGPRPIRLVGFASLVFLQLLIAATGNYGFFNLLAIVICLTLLEDRDWDWLRTKGQTLLLHGKSRGLVDHGAAGAGEWEGQGWSWARRLAVGIAGGIIMAVTGTQTAETVAPDVLVPSELLMLGQYMRPLRSTNTYGLFAVMTTTRPEIIVEGSDDGVSWRPYRFRWKPCELDRRPRFAAPHLPRLDWQMWFAALAGDCRSVPWFFAFEQKLLEGSPAVLGLLRENPFPTRPPRSIRARLSLYKFTPLGSRDWWSRDDQGLFCPPLTIDDMKQISGQGASGD